MYIVRFKYTDSAGYNHRVYFSLQHNLDGNKTSVKLVSNRSDAWLFNDPANAADVCRLMTMNQSRYEGRVIKC